MIVHVKIPKTALDGEPVTSEAREHILANQAATTKTSNEKEEPNSKPERKMNLTWHL